MRSHLPLTAAAAAAAAASLLLLPVLASPAAHARPAGPSAFCAVYPESAHCAGRLPTCSLCHTSTGYAPDWNEYGLGVVDALATLGHPFDPGPPGDASYLALIEQAIADAELGDHDGDGVDTLEEIVLGTGPGDVLSFYTEPAAPLGDVNPAYAVGAYDFHVALQRARVAFCGTSVTYDERVAFAALADDEARRTELHRVLDECMASAHWRNEALPSLADDKIKPIPRFEQWRWDYRLWRYANLPACRAGDDACGDDLPRSARDLLTGQYHVRETAPGRLTRDNGAAPAVDAPCVTNADCAFDELCSSGTCDVLGGYQPLQDRTKRAGMITTTWFHFFNTMFSAMPRTTAAQAMRSYLGMDIARQEGLVFNPDEPADVDNKGVDGVGCIECHQHLDAATYAFAYYRGIENNRCEPAAGAPGPLTDCATLGDVCGAGNPCCAGFDCVGGGASTFSTLRPVVRGLWAVGGDRQPYLLDQPVNDLVDWAQQASASDFFLRNHALTFYRHAVGREPRPDEAAELEALWRTIPGDNYETPALLHRLIDTLAFGGV